MSRPQIGIGRLPTRRPSNNESRQAMNCKSCRKRKIKCNRLKPSCEACQVFNCPCIYDAIPKKRGPKTDVLEALVKRVNGLEKRLKDETKSEPTEDDEGGSSLLEADQPLGDESTAVEQKVPSLSPTVERERKRPSMVPIVPQAQTFLNRETIAFTDALLDTYFARIHSKPYYILDEANTRQRLRGGQLPQFMINAIHAVSIRYVPHLCGGYSGAVRTSEEYAIQARAGIEVDEPSIDHLQALLLLAIASFQAGKGRKSYMLLSHAISMAFALELHREVPADMRVATIEREGRRKLFWTCYLMDRFNTSGSKRPPLISDESISLRYPVWTASGSQRCMEGSYFPNGSSLPHAAGSSYDIHGSAAMLVEVVRILGVTNKYLNSGGVKGDSHFPWHSQSALSKIRADLEKWAASTHDAFASVGGLFGQPDSITLALSKLIYHLIHCLLYRPFLPVDLAELSGNSQNQSWQIDATHICFMHANAIVELVDIGKSTGIHYWPSFVGYCVCTAGTIHIHGAHYVSLRDGDAFTNSAHFLSREMAQLADLAFIWGGVNHQRETMQTVYASHSRLVQSLACSPIRFSPVFQMEDFFDRYPGARIDGAHVTFRHIPTDDLSDRLEVQDMEQAVQAWRMPAAQDQQFPPQPLVNTQPLSLDTAQRDYKRRRMTEGSPYPYPTPTVEAQPNPFDQQPQQVHGASLTQQHRPPLSQHHTAPSSVPHYETHDIPDDSRPSDESSNPTLAQGAFSPSFALSPMTQGIVEQSRQNKDLSHLHAMTTAEEAQTPGGVSASAQSSNTVDAESDPFLSFLEQLAENNENGVQGDLDIFMHGHDSMFAEVSA